MKLLEEYNDYESYLLQASDLNYAVYLSSLDKKMFYDCKNGILKKLPEEKTNEMNVLLLLEQLGYPMDELGTYLYKNVIINVINYLENVNTEREIRDCKCLVKELKDCFSNFYLNIARFELEMGVKTFHKNVKDTFSKIDYSKININLFSEIFGNIKMSIDYGELAFILGSYLSGKLVTKKENNIEYDEVKIKKMIKPIYFD